MYKDYKETQKSLIYFKVISFGTDTARDNKLRYFTWHGPLLALTSIKYMISYYMPLAALPNLPSNKRNLTPK